MQTYQGENEGPAEVTEALDAWSRGDPQALDRLMVIVEKELRLKARRELQRERPNHTLQATAVVNEIYLKFNGQRQVNLKNRAQFFKIATRFIRRVLVDYARNHQAQKRGNGAIHIPLDDELVFPGQSSLKMLVLNDALHKLEEKSERQRQIAEMRILVGMNHEEIALAENISRTTVSREWKTARLFLQCYFRKHDEDP